MSELQPCPHCGGQPELIEIPPHTHKIATFMPDHPGSWVVENCGCGAGMIDDTREAVLARWNRRASPWQELPATPTPGVAPWDGKKFWGNDEDDAIAMFWHPGFGEFVSRFNRMTLAPGYTYEDTGLNYQDHSPVIHKPTHWRRIDTLPPPPVREGG